MLSNIKGKRDGNGRYRGPECLKHFVSCFWVGFQLTEKSRQRTKKLTGTLVLQDRVSQLLSCNLLIALYLQSSASFKRRLVTLL